MRKLGGALAVLLLVAAAIFVIGELTETDEDADEPAATVPGATAPEPERTAPSSTPGAEPGAGQNGGNEEEAAIERAVFLYLERAERGEVGPSGLPTSDEASVRRISVSSPAGTAVAFLVGGARFELGRRGGRWVVVRAVPADIEPQPPSGAP